MKPNPVVLLVLGGIVFGFPQPSYSVRCKEIGLVAFPSGSVRLPLNGIVVLSSYGRLTRLVRSIEDFNPRLRAENETIKLSSEQKDRRVFGHDVFLTPERPLRPDTTYSLEFDDAGEEIRKLYERSPLSWTTGTKFDNEKPVWIGQPYLKGKGVDSLGRLFAEVVVDARDDNEIAYVVKAKPKKQTDWTIAALFETKDKVIEIFNVLDESCGARIALGTGQKWILKVVAIDAAGNRNEAKGLIEIEFTETDRRPRNMWESIEKKQ
jgi:hypothetical protein